MKTPYHIICLLTAVFLVSPMGRTWGQTDANQPGPTRTGQPYLGVKLNPVPQLLRKHLQLAEDQGLIIYNILTDSPADRAGLDRDDIIVGFQGRDLTGYENFVSDIRRAGVGAEVALTIIHLGERKTIKATLAAKKETETVEWKYPPDRPRSWPGRPGRMFQLPRGERRWRQVPFDQIPEMKDYFKHFFREEQYTYQFGEGDETYEITIEGDPDSNDAKIIVHDGQTEHETRASQIEDLPDKYRPAAHEALEKARQSTHEWGVRRWFPDDDDYFRPTPPPEFMPHPLGPRTWPKAAEEDPQLRQRMQELMDRIEQMEKQQKKLLERLEKLED